MLRFFVFFLFILLFFWSLSFTDFPPAKHVGSRFDVICTGVWAGEIMDWTHLVQKGQSNRLVTTNLDQNSNFKNREL